MKASTLVSLFIAGLFLGFVLGAAQPETKCGKGMQVSNCSCSQICNQPINFCPIVFCSNTTIHCQCVSGKLLPTPDATYCVSKDECPPSPTGDNQPGMRCTKGTPTSECACNQICNQPIHSCPARLCPNSTICQCIDEKLLPYPGATYCVPKSECPPPNCTTST